MTIVVDKINDLKSRLKESQSKLQDINKNLEETVRQRTSELAKEKEKSFNAAKLASLGQMAGDIAHEINNPLTIIDGNAMMIEKDLRKDQIDRDKLENHVLKIRDTVKRISMIVIGLKNLTRKEVKSSKTQTSLKDVFDDVLGVVKEKLMSHGVSLAFNSSNPYLTKKVLCDRIMLSQTLVNLINNSFYEVQKLEEQWIKIEVLFEDHTIQIVVTDSGKGIPKDIQSKIFDPFYTTKPVGEGTGLGLSIAAKTLLNHGGTLEINSNCINTQLVLTLPGYSP
jgi:two-component system NtrC family sensor kinase